MSLGFYAEIRDAPAEILLISAALLVVAVLTVCLLILSLVRWLDRSDLLCSTLAI